MQQTGGRVKAQVSKAATEKKIKTLAIDCSKPVEDKVFNTGNFA